MSLVNKFLKWISFNMEKSRPVHFSMVLDERLFSEAFRMNSVFPRGVRVDKIDDPESTVCGKYQTLEFDLKLESDLKLKYKMTSDWNGVTCRSCNRRREEFQREMTLFAQRYADLVKSEVETAKKEYRKISKKHQNIVEWIRAMNVKKGSHFNHANSRKIEI